MVLWMNEMKMNLKSLLIWIICVGGLCFGCILLYTSLEGSLQEMADSYSNMGAMSAALGMDKLSIATLPGFYATEIGMMFGLGGAMFTALLGTSIVSKEEQGHTSEFLSTFPISRCRVLAEKYLALLSNIVIFNVVCMVVCLFGFLIMGEGVPAKEMCLYHAALLLMQIEIGSICFAISTVTRKNQMGLGLGIVILAFAADMMCRIVPAIENIKYITPFYYANAADIFTELKLDSGKIGIGIGVTVVCIVISWYIYTRKDLAS